MFKRVAPQPARGWWWEEQRFKKRNILSEHSRTLLKIFILFISFFLFPSASVTSKCQLRPLLSLESDFKWQHVVKCVKLQTPLGIFPFDFSWLSLEFLVLSRWYLSRGAQHHQLDGSSGVALRRHGAPQRLHGGVIGAAQQRLAIYRDQLVIDA